MTAKEKRQALFREQINYLVDMKIFRNRREIVDKLGWNETNLSAAMAGRRPAPEDILAKVDKLYKDAKSPTEREVMDMAESTVAQLEKEIKLLYKLNDKLEKENARLEAELAEIKKAR